MRKVNKFTKKFNVLMLGVAAIGAVIFATGCLIK